MDLSRGERRREKRDADAMPAIEMTNAFAAVEQEDLRHAVESALATLPEEQREVLVLKIWGELTFAQIAVTLAISSDTAASRYRYALQRLQAALKQEAAP